MGPGVNVVFGKNASGKTNLLEAALVLLQGKSYRAKDKDLIRGGSEWARLDAGIDGDKRTVKIKADGGRTEKEFEFKGKNHKKLGFSSRLPVVVFEPNHLQLITRGPDQRREYVDDILERINPEYKSLINKYRRSLAQRNHLLKLSRGQASSGQMFVWDLKLAEIGEQIALARFNLAKQLNSRLSEKYSSIAKNKANIELEYLSHFPIDQYATQMVKRLEKNIKEDMLRGFTVYGPHREALDFKINGQPMSVVGSRGEVRSLMLALKILELDLVEHAHADKPILLLDDVFSELDSGRRRALVGSIKGFQTIITTTEADSLPKTLKTGPYRTIRIK